MVYLGYGLIAVVALLTLIISVREIASRDNAERPPDKLPDRRLVLHSRRQSALPRKTDRRAW